MEEPLSPDQLPELLPYGNRYAVPFVQSKVRFKARILFNKHDRPGAEDEAQNLEQSLQKIGCDVIKVEWAETKDINTAINDTLHGYLGEYPLKHNRFYNI